MATSPNYGWLEPDNTDLVKNGALAIRTLGNAIDTTMATMTPKSIVDAKGDLIAASAADTPARLAVGNNGETLVADSSTATGLSYQANWAAGKNKLINADFNINQRAFTSTTTTATFGFDRWNLSATDGTTTYSAQTFTLGAAPVAGYEATNFARLVSTGQTTTTALSALNQPIENVRTFAGQTITVSFWAKAASGTPNITVFGLQNFGGSGSSPVFIAANNKQAISTSWARYSFQLAIPSIAGKTISGGGDLLRLYVTTSAGTDRNSYTNSLGIQSATIDIWGVQAEAGTVATAFQTATGTIQGELAAASRYYQVLASGTQKFLAPASVYTAGQLDILITYPEMRIAPSLVATSGTGYYLLIRNGGSDPFNSITLNGYTTPRGAALYNNTEISSTAGNAGWVYLDNASASVALNAEL